MRINSAAFGISMYVSASEPQSHQLHAVLTYIYSFMWVTRCQVPATLLVNNMQYCIGRSKCIRIYGCV